MTKGRNGMRFYFLNGDVNWREYGGLFYARVGKRRFEVIRWGGAETDYDHPQAGPGGITVYHAEKTAVDLDFVNDDWIKGALAMSGLTRDENGIWNGGDKLAPARGKLHDLILLECLVHYGVGDRIAYDTDTNWRRLYRNIRNAW